MLQPRNDAAYYLNFKLTKFQVGILKRLANGRVKVYCMPAGVQRDKRRDEINLQFNEVLQLVEMGLVNDVSDGEKFKGIVEQHRVNEGRDVVVIWLNGFGQEMWGRTPWDKRRN